MSEKISIHQDSADLKFVGKRNAGGALQLEEWTDTTTIIDDSAIVKVDTTKTNVSTKSKHNTDFRLATTTEEKNCIYRFRYTAYSLSLIHI